MGAAAALLLSASPVLAAAKIPPIATGEFLYWCECLISFSSTRLARFDHESIQWWRFTAAFSNILPKFPRRTSALRHCHATYTVSGVGADPGRCDRAFVGNTIGQVSIASTGCRCLTKTPGRHSCASTVAMLKLTGQRCWPAHVAEAKCTRIPFG